MAFVYKQVVFLDPDVGGPPFVIEVPDVPKFLRVHHLAPKVSAQLQDQATNSPTALDFLAGLELGNIMGQGWFTNWFNNRSEVMM